MDCLRHRRAAVVLILLIQPFVFLYGFPGSRPVQMVLQRFFFQLFPGDGIVSILLPEAALEMNMIGNPLDTAQAFGGLSFFAAFFCAPAFFAGSGCQGDIFRLDRIINRCIDLGMLRMLLLFAEELLRD